jgi:hypothetical protein
MDPTMNLTTIANLALAKVGNQVITSLSDTSMEARFCNLLIQPVINECLRASDWNWAKKTASLSQLPTTPPFDFQYWYALPSDFSRSIQMNAWQVNQARVPFEIWGNNLVTDASVANLLYICQATDPTMFDPMFSELCATLLASRLAKPIGGSLDLAKQLQGEFKEALGVARRTDAANERPRLKFNWTESDLISARWSDSW